MARTKKRSDGRYSRQIYLGKDEDGKRRYKTIYADTDREAQRLADEYRTPPSPREWTLLSPKSLWASFTIT